MIIQEVDIFGGFSGEVEEELADAITTESFGEGDVLFREGDPADCFYILQDGAVSVKVTGAKMITHIALKQGEAVGWSSLAGRDTYSATVECDKPSTLMKIHKDHLDRILRRHPSSGLLFYKRLAKLVGERLINCYAELVKLREAGE